MCKSIAYLLLVALSALSALTVAKAACNAAEPSCFCTTTLKGTWKADPTVLRPLCRKTITHGGLQRIVDLYFPAEIKKTTYTPLISLHGAFSAEWFLQEHPEWIELQKTWKLPMAGNVAVSDSKSMTGSPLTSNETNSKDQQHLQARLDNVVLVVPQATGSPEKGQIWNSIFWRGVGSKLYVVDPSVDDVGFIAHLVGSVNSEVLPGMDLEKPYLQGGSNGGMLVQAVLCKQPGVINELSGVAMTSSSLGSDFADSDCQQKLPGYAPLLWVHGTVDETLPYNGGTFEGVKMLGIEETVQKWAADLGCKTADPAKPPTVYEDQGAGVVCRNYCAGQKDKMVVLCTVAGGGHNMRYKPSEGYVSGLVQWGVEDFAGDPKPL